MVFTANADENDTTNAQAAASRNTFFRPHVSAKNPHKCDEDTMPK